MLSATLFDNIKLKLCAKHTFAFFCMLTRLRIQTEPVGQAESESLNEAEVEIRNHSRGPAGDSQESQE